jgi:hypothetical protein
MNQKSVVCCFHWQWPNDFFQQEDIFSHIVLLLPPTKTRESQEFLYSSCHSSLTLQPKTENHKWISIIAAITHSGALIFSLHECNEQKFSQLAQQSQHHWVGHIPNRITRTSKLGCNPFQGLRLVFRVLNIPGCYVTSQHLAAAML